MDGLPWTYSEESFGGDPRCCLAEHDPVASAYIERVITVVIPDRGPTLRWCVEADTSVDDHCRAQGYQVSAGIFDRFGYWTWKIAGPGRAGEVDLEVNGEVYLLTFPG